jgi:hypothetical protein
MSRESKGPESRGVAVVTNPTLTSLQDAFARVRQLASKGGEPRTISVNLLEAIARALACQWATFWQVSSTGTYLYSAVTWKDGRVAADRLEQDTYPRNLTMSEGTAGQVGV